MKYKQIPRKEGANLKIYTPPGSAPDRHQGRREKFGCGEGMNYIVKKFAFKRWRKVSRKIGLEIHHTLTKAYIGVMFGKVFVILMI